MRTLKELLPQGQGLHTRIGVESVDEKTVFFVCKKVLIEEYGMQGGENIIPSFYKEKKLFLSPRSSLWSSEIWLGRDRLRNRINITLGCEAVLEIKIAQQQ